MKFIERIIAQRSGMLFHVASSVLIFIIWRITGMPSPGLLGRLIPLSWMITAIIFGKRGIPRLSVYFLAAFIVFSLFWTLDPSVELFASACGLLGVFPGILNLSSGKYGFIPAMIPIIPLILILVPFTGDEPHYAYLTEQFISPEASRFDSFSSQIGDTVEGISHHQNLYPALLIPGYPFSIAGMRSMNLLFAFAALLLISIILKDSGTEERKKLLVMGFLLVPGCSILGLVYPGWLALAVFLSGVYAALNSKNRILWVIPAAIVLVLIKFRFIGISIGLLTALVIESKGRRKFILPVIFTGLAAAGLLFDLVVLNGRIFWVRFGNISFIKTLIIQPLYRMPELIISAGSSLVDIESGLLWRAPWVLAGFAGLPVLKRRNRRLLLWLGLPALTYYLILIFWSARDWSGMPTPAGRMLLPLMPVLLVSLGYMMKRKEVRLLIWASLGISAVYFIHPILRFNYADGTDALVSSVLGPFSNLTEWIPSAVRLNIPIFAGWILFSAAIVWLLVRRSRYTEYTIISVFLLICFFGGMKKKSWEAEDIPPEYRNFCTIYPGERDPESRKFWFFTREQMLKLSNPEDEVILPVPEKEKEFISLVIFHRSFQSGPATGITVSCGEWRDSIYSSSEEMEAPAWITILKYIRIPERPENLEEIRSEFTIPVISDSISIKPLGMESRNGRYHGIYLDRIIIE